MKLREYICKDCESRGIPHHLHGDAFIEAFDKAYGLKPIKPARVI